MVHPELQFPVLRSYGILSQVRGVVTSLLGERLDTGSKILIIVGAGRSGNTLARKLLMQYGSIYIPPESYVWGEILNSFLKTTALTWAERVELSLAKMQFHPEFATFEVGSLGDFCRQAKDWPRTLQTPGNLIFELYRWLAKSKQIEALWVGDKTPANLMRIGLVSKMFPNARYLYLLRDGVSVADSYRRAGLGVDLAAGAVRWQRSQIAWRKFSAKIPEECRRQLRFEDLLEAPRTSIEGALQQFGIPLLASPRDARGFLGDVPMRRHHQRAASDHVDAVSSSKRPLLTNEERAQLDAIFGASLVAAGYPRIQ